MDSTQADKLELLEWMASLQNGQTIRELIQWKEQRRQTGLARYNREIEEADSEIEKGEYLTHEEATKQLRSWREK